MRRYRVDSERGLSLEKLRVWCTVARMGTVAQWISAVAALTAVGVTVYGLISAWPVFQNAQLKEDNARLDLRLRQKDQDLSESRHKTWDFVCEQFVLRARTFSGTSFWSAGTYRFSDLQQLEDIFGAKSLRPVGTGRDAIDNATKAEEFGLLLQTDRSLFESLVNQLIEQNTDQLSVSLFMPDTDGARKEDVDREFGKAKTAQQKFRTILVAFAKSCRAQNPVDIEATTSN